MNSHTSHRLSPGKVRRLPRDNDQIWRGWSWLKRLISISASLHTSFQPPEAPGNDLLHWCRRTHAPDQDWTNGL